MREIVLTDVHGCYDELQALLAEARFGPDDIIVGASDSVDKGPYSAKVVKFFRALAAEGRCRHIRGNHEVKFLRFARRYRKDPDRAMQHKHGESMLKTLLELDESDLQWLDSGAFFARLQQINGIVIHAGLEPATAIDLSADQTLLDPGPLSPLIYCRYLRDGKMVKLGGEDASCQFWADCYDGRYGHVFYGHQPWFCDAPRTTVNTTGLDLGCVAGGRLAAAVIEEGHVQLVSVPGKLYAAPYDKKADD